MGVRIKDIAEEAGVSPATVSLVINNKPGVGQETRDRIQSIIREFEYKGPSTRQNANDETGSICFLQIARHGHILNRDHDVFIADYIRGMSKEAKNENFSLKLVTYKTTPIEEIVDYVQKSDDSGVIILGTELSYQDVEAFSVIEKPIVFLDSFYKYLRFDFIDMNNEDSVWQIINNFARKGHREIGMISSIHPTPNFRIREAAFRESLNRLEIPYQKDLSFSVDSTFNGAYTDMMEKLSKNDILPTAFFCANDIIACGCLKALTETGYNVPGDISLCGFDNLPITSMSTPGMTTIEVSKHRMGRMAVQLLTDRILEDADSPPAKVVFGGKLIERESIRDLN